MNRHPFLLRVRDHLAAMLATLVCAHTIGLVDLAGLARMLPHGVIGLDKGTGQLIGAALCGLTYALVLTWQLRRRLVAGPLYRCGESRPDADYGKSFAPGDSRLLDGWQYR
ncbi:hypothetical protein [Blastomonas fulva]|jgi:hypothetical protein|uniref:hypothetical protein n=1 Tax=Blastomonas fulva TaxID=1550728 RepID=UPI003D2C4286